MQSNNVSTSTCDKDSDDQYSNSMSKEEESGEQMEIRNESDENSMKSDW